MRQSDSPVIDRLPSRCTYLHIQGIGLSGGKGFTGADAKRMEAGEKPLGFDSKIFLNEIKSAFAQLSNAKGLSPAAKINLLENVRVALDAEKSAIEQQYIPRLPNPNDSYPRYPGRGEDALKWLETHWGSYLKYFGAEKDYLYQDQLRKLDPKLISTLKTMRYRDSIAESGKKLRDIIPIKSDRLTEKINALLCNDIRNDVVSAYLLSHKRKSRKQALRISP